MTVAVAMATVTSAILVIPMSTVSVVAPWVVINGISWCNHHWSWWIGPIDHYGLLVNNLRLLVNHNRRWLVNHLRLLVHHLGCLIHHLGCLVDHLWARVNHHLLGRWKPHTDTPPHI